MKIKSISKKLLTKSIISLVENKKCTVSNLKEYIAAGFDIHYQEPKTNHNLLIIATVKGNEPVILELIKLGSDVNFNFNTGDSYLSCVANFDLLKTVKKLLDMGITPVDEKFIKNSDHTVLCWLKKYETQKDLLNKYPELYALLKKKETKYGDIIDIVHPNIKREFAYLEQSYELNLF